MKRTSLAKFAMNEAAHVASINQVIFDWANELDRNNGLSIREADVLTNDCRYFVGGEWREGSSAVAQFYEERHVRLAGGNGVPVMRHIISNLRVHFSANDTASASYVLLFFAALGTPPFTSCDPSAVADVEMQCRRSSDGRWRICRFESVQIFRRSE